MSRVLLHIAIMLAPIFFYGVYLRLRRDIEAKSRLWTLRGLFLSGFVLSLGLWVWSITNTPRNRTECNQPARFENGVLIPSNRSVCPQDSAPVARDNYIIESTVSTPASPDTGQGNNVTSSKDDKDISVDQTSTSTQTRSKTHDQHQ